MILRWGFIVAIFLFAIGCGPSNYKYPAMNNNGYMYSNGTATYMPNSNGMYDPNMANTSTTSSNSMYY